MSQHFLAAYAVFEKNDKLELDVRLRYKPTPCSRVILEKLTVA
jgi:hypothetical protein